ncbi:hypothetical protein M011DRAFT_467072 [Sporormia fimetaria CBS 119925]|uniref:Carbohydrate-binding module family 18 protein n=1 Tax=Sporormia fimetaria CBS 119925 TaxID=1340428 RepID=A0A6A6VE73_9PLEO|nr:hypothetical protein M011DRAFT_467072 [Sporormia fimetaria CBS 119925]
MKLTALFIAGLAAFVTGTPINEAANIDTANVPADARLPNIDVSSLDAAHANASVNAVASGNCNFCDDYFNNCHKGCWWYSGCTIICRCKTMAQFGCKECGWGCS